MTSLGVVSQPPTLRVVVLAGFDDNQQAVDDYRAALSKIGCTAYDPFTDGSNDSWEQRLQALHLQLSKAEQTHGWVCHLVKKEEKGEKGGSKEGSKQTSPRNDDATDNDVRWKQQMTEAMQMWKSGPHVSVRRLTYDRECVDCVMAGVAAICSWESPSAPLPFGERLPAKDYHTLVVPEGPAKELTRWFKLAGMGEMETACAEAVRILGQGVENRLMFVKSGLLEPLVQTLQPDRLISARGTAAGALRNLSFNDKTEQAVAAAGPIVPLVKLLVDGDNTGKSNAALALKEISYDSQNKIHIAALGAIPKLIHNTAKANNDVKTHNAMALFQLIEKNNQNAYAAVEGGAVRPLADLMQGKGITGDRERVEAMTVAVKALVTLTSPPTGQCGVAALPEVAEAQGAVVQIIRLMQNAPFEETKLNAGKLVYNMCCNEECQPLLFQPGARFLPALIWAITKGPLDGLARAVECLYILSLKPENRPAIEEAGAADPLTAIRDTSRDLEAKHLAGKTMQLLDDIGID
eukprot:TRINITY_DN122628_c0_g1_i1.p1 TRINITY_DN122628_c0_g1~~TRINITY_DN122628_c0_g1_i1.p1  ORF type:complete len:521 (-),score=109.79 TRINITY_DN122628_c0_g1_i1:112-1674(-)